MPAHFPKKNTSFDSTPSATPIISTTSTLLKFIGCKPLLNQYFAHSLKNNRGYTLKSERQAKPAASSSSRGSPRGSSTLSGRSTLRR
jgi:hypothetical protein